MMKLNIQKLLDDRGKTRYWLVKQMNTNYKTINRLCDNQSAAIHLDTIEKLCSALECEPNDLFYLEP